MRLRPAGGRGRSGFRPSVASEFREAGDKVIGKVKSKKADDATADGLEEGEFRAACPKTAIIALVVHRIQALSVTGGRISKSAADPDRTAGDLREGRYPLPAGARAGRRTLAGKPEAPARPTGDRGRRGCAMFCELAQLNQFGDLGQAKVLKSFETGFKGRHYRRGSESA